MAKPSLTDEAPRSLWRRIWHWMHDQVAQEVPDAVAACEFDCRKHDCEEEELATCDRRIQRAAGEQWPRPGIPSGDQTPMDSKAS